MPGYAWYVGTLRDGRITTRIPAVGTQWQTVMDDAGSLTAQLTLADPDVAALNPYLAAEPCRCFLAVAYIDGQGTETFLEAGPIWTHGYNPLGADGQQTKVLTIGAAGVWSYYDHRKVLPVLAAGTSPASVVTTYTTSLGTLAKRLVQLAHTHTAGSLPIVLPADEAGSVVTNYPGYGMSDVGQALRDVAAAGCEVQFAPRRQAADPRYLEWVMRVGTAANPLLTQPGDDWIWDASAVKSSVVSIGVNRDGSKQAARAWVQGPGTDSGTTFGRADSTTLTAAGFPLLETVTQDTDAASQAVLDGDAAALLAQSRYPTETWALQARRDDTPTVADTTVGDWMQVTIGTDPYLPAGTYRTRITGKSGDDSPVVSYELAPTSQAGT